MDVIDMFEWQRGYIANQNIEFPPYILAMMRCGNACGFHVKAESFMRKRRPLLLMRMLRRLRGVSEETSHNAWLVTIERQADDGRALRVSRAVADVLCVDFAGDVDTLARAMISPMVDAWIREASR